MIFSLSANRFLFFLGFIYSHIMHECMKPPYDYSQIWLMRAWEEHRALKSWAGQLHFYKALLYILVCGLLFCFDFKKTILFACLCHSLFFIYFLILIIGFYLSWLCLHTAKEEKIQPCPHYFCSGCDRNHWVAHHTLQNEIHCHTLHLSLSQINFL